MGGLNIEDMDLGSLKIEDMDPGSVRCYISGISDAPFFDNVFEL
jgi:hypothetical protein